MYVCIVLWIVDTTCSILFAVFYSNPFVLIAHIHTNTWRLRELDSFCSSKQTCIWVFESYSIPDSFLPNKEQQITQMKFTAGFNSFTWT